MKNLSRTERSERLWRRLKVRVREQTCLYAIEELSGHKDLSIDEYLQRAAELLPSGLQDPIAGGCRIFYERKEFFSKRFERTRRTYAASIIINGKKRGEVRICYRRRSRPVKGTGFLQAEHDLIDSVAKRIGLWIERKVIEEMVKQLPQRIIQAQEGERERISREIHDDLGQSLATVKLFVQSKMSQPEFQHPVVKKAGGDFVRILDGVIQKTRHISQGLRPPALEVTGLTMAVADLIKEFRFQKRVKIRFQPVPLDGLVFPGDRINFYRIIQEALNNVLRHSRASRAEIRMRLEYQKLTVTISDNGKGFSLKPAVLEKHVHDHLGLSTMKERARLLKGKISIRSNPGKGTVVILTVPVS